MRSEKKTATSILIVLLVYVFIAGNTSGELVLCIGADGHIAFEPVIHEHFQIHAHFEQNELSSLGYEHDRHVDDPHCKPCIDMPIFIGPTDNRLPIKPAKPNPDTLVSLLETVAISDYQLILPAVPRRSYSATDENRFLRSIILLV
jgi:hypothetical protein